MNLNSRTINLSFLKRFTYGKRVRPARDWLVLIMIALITLGGFVVAGAWVYLEGARARDGQVFPFLVPNLSDDALERSEALFERRALEAERYRSEYQFVDPALPGS
jgi:hypothetical protein